MANIASSKKDARRSAVRAVKNRSVRSSVKTRVTRVRRAVTEGAAEGLQELAAAAISGLDRAAAKGILHRNNAARRKSRLMKRLQSLETAPAAPGPGTKPARAKAAPSRPAAPKKAAAPKKPAAEKPAARKPAARKPAAKKAAPKK